MLPLVRFGRTELQVTRLALGGFPFGGVNRARQWDPYTPDGRQDAIRTIHAALDAGINYIDTAPGYGNGHSETITGEATRDRRSQFHLATKVGYRDATPEQIGESVEQSLLRLRTDVIDVIQFHGGMYTDDDVQAIVHGGLYDALARCRDEGKIRFIGFTVEEPWTAKPLIATGLFDVVQVRYNLIYQSAALHVLSEASDADMGVAVMRPMTSGILQRLVTYLAPQWHEAHDLYDVALKFVLSDSRVHIANVGMRWPAEVEKNVALASSFQPPFDMVDLPRMTAKIYQTDDRMHGME
jgi:aryl-alcohol dehydrogenase-like predicted oxidoreductase